MSPAKLNLTLQADFVRTELETGHRMVAQAMDQRGMREDAAAAESLDLARVALSGAERHLEAVSLPARQSRELNRELRELRRRIESFAMRRREIS